MKYDCIIGIDPGTNGGLAVWIEGRNVQTIRMPTQLIDLREYFQTIKRVSDHPIIFLEKLQLRHDDISVNPGKAFRIQKLMMAFQQLKDFIEVEGIPYCLVHPISWQAYLKLRLEGEDKKDRKNRYKSVASYYYPEVKVTLWNSDAILLMHFGWMKQQYDPDWIDKNIPSNVK